MFPLKPREMIEHLNLLNPIYQPTSAYGHFGREPGRLKVGKGTFNTFTWEKTDRVPDLRRGLRCGGA